MRDGVQCGAYETRGALSFVAHNEICQRAWHPFIFEGKKNRNLGVAQNIKRKWCLNGVARCFRRRRWSR